MQNNDINFYLQDEKHRANPILELPLFLRLEKDQQETPIHKHQYVEVVIVTDGKAMHCSHGERYQISRGDVLVIPRGIVHSYTETDHLCMANLLFDPEKLPMPRLDLYALPGYSAIFQPDPEKSLLPAPQIHLTEEAVRDLKNLLERMDRECRLRRPGGNFRLLGAFIVLLGELAFRATETMHNSKHACPFQLGELLWYLNANFKKNIRLENLLAKVPMSRSTLNRHFIRATGMTPMKYLQKLRLEHAEKLLLSTDLSVTEIAYAAGFNDVSHFTRLFRETNHMAPSRYRKH